MKVKAVCTAVHGHSSSPDWWFTFEYIASIMVAGEFDTCKTHKIELQHTKIIKPVWEVGQIVEFEITPV